MAKTRKKSKCGKGKAFCLGCLKCYPIPKNAIREETQTPKAGRMLKVKFKCPKGHTITTFMKKLRD